MMIMSKIKICQLYTSIIEKEYNILDLLAMIIQNLISWIKHYLFKQ